MYRLSAVVYGVVAGAVGAAVWAVIARFTGLEIGWIAWGVGILVGIGVAMGNKGEGSVPAGILAAFLAILSVVGGKYIMVRMVLPDEEELVASSVAVLNDEESVVSYLADAVVQEFESQGKAVNWPDEADPSHAAAAADYPADIWAVAQARWDGMSVGEQESYRAELRSNIQASAAAFRDMFARTGFFHTFGLMDVVFFALAVLTAFKIGRAGALTDRGAYA